VVEGGGGVTDETPLDWAERLVAPYRDTLERRRYLFTYKCLMLARDLETCEALMRGEKVPKSRLRPEWAKAYGIS
jgi:hypothetical protein